MTTRLITQRTNNNYYLNDGDYEKNIFGGDIVPNLLDQLPTHIITRPWCKHELKSSVTRSDSVRLGHATVSQTNNQKNNSKSWWRTIKAHVTHAHASRPKTLPVHSTESTIKDQLIRLVQQQWQHQQQQQQQKHQQKGAQPTGT